MAIQSKTQLKNAYDNQYADGDTFWRDLGARGKAQNILDLCSKLTVSRFLDVGSGDGAVLKKLDETYPGMTDYLIDEHGALRHHINIFIGDKMIADRNNLSDDIKGEEEILIFQALSGG